MTLLLAARLAQLALPASMISAPARSVSIIVKFAPRKPTAIRVNQVMLPLVMVLALASTITTTVQAKLQIFLSQT